MPSIGVNKDEFSSELNSLGEIEVRSRVLNGIYTSVNGKKQLAEEWLLRKQDARDVAGAPRQESFRAERAHVSERTATATERQAEAAERATWIALAALMISVVALIVSLIAFRTP